MKTKVFDRILFNVYWIICSLLILIFKGVYAQEAEFPFYPNGTYTEAIPSPDGVLGFSLGKKPVNYAEVTLYFKTLAEKSPRVRLVESGETHEHRPLYYLIVSSEENLARLDAIQEDISKLADPRKIKSNNEAQQIIDTSPAVAWLMYSIHGDELSGTDASLQVAYQLAAGTDSATVKLLNDLIVGIDPMQNPDGRERYVAQMQQWAGLLSHSDAQSIQHNGVWPGSRTNHYFFDLNRDWFILAHPESRARVKTILQWNPQIVIDAHEMYNLDTFLFSPSSEPYNPNLNPMIIKWMNVFAADDAKAFDQYGWSYYTRSWAVDYYPGYGSAWPYYVSAVAILYEQAGVDGSLIKRADGTILTFREAVHHQFISSIANLTTASDNRRALLKDFYGMKKEAINSKSDTNVRAFCIEPGKNPARAQRLMERLLMQGIEVEMAEKDFRMKNLRSFWDSKPVTKVLSKGTYIISLLQPLSPLIKAILEFDPRISTSVLQTERETLEKGKGTTLEDVTGWSMLLAYNLEAYTSVDFPSVKKTKVRQLPVLAGAVLNSEQPYGFIIEYQDDGAVHVLLKLFELGYTVRVAKEPFEIEGRFFSRGSLLLRTIENPSMLIEDIQKVAESTGTNIYGVKTALSQKGPDLGGQKFQLLKTPRIAVLTGPAIDMNNFGALWYLLDYELKCPHTILDYSDFDDFDLQKYNVLILPSFDVGPKSYMKIFNENDIKKLKAWISNGGTMIGISNGAAFLADTTTGISQVRIRRQALKDLHLYEKAVQREENRRTSKIDSLAIWEWRGSIINNYIETQQTEINNEIKQTEKMDEKELAEQDKQKRLYKPQGAILHVDLDEKHWMNFGVGEKVPAMVYTSYAFLSRKPVQTPARFSKASQLRLSGVLWPEARKRWEKSAYATREEIGKGQVILFADEPNFRSYFYGTTRLLINSLLLGPGFGTQQAEVW